MLNNKLCPVCENPGGNFSETFSDIYDCYSCECKNCGNFRISSSDHDFLDLNKEGRAALSHSIWKRQNFEDDLIITPKDVENAKDKSSLPNIVEQADNLILYLGNTFHHGKTFSQDDTCFFQAKIGAIDIAAVRFLLIELEKKKVIEIKWQDPDNIKDYKLTFDGWLWHAELQHSIKDTARVFMAMPFPWKKKKDEKPEEQEERLLRNKVQRTYKAFQTAVENNTGFHLENALKDNPKMGDIMDHLHNEIRSARFVVADLTLQNDGAYWEAGLAHGLGKKVIYTCHEDHFNDIHFDTKQMQVIPWTPKKDDLKTACDKLVAMIRREFEDAWQEDPEPE